jgi:hypothetical protein
VIAMGLPFMPTLWPLLDKSSAHLILLFAIFYVPWHGA